VFIDVCNESQDDTEETIAKWVAKLPSYMDGCKPKDTANDDDETE
jgi:hypothetical protein